MIPISTTGGTGGPLWYIGGDRFHPTCFLDKNNVMNGIREIKLAMPTTILNTLEFECSKNCDYHNSLRENNSPDNYCPFMREYRKYLDTVDINYLLDEFKRVAEEVRKVNNFLGEPEIVLMVYESASLPCGERPCLVDYFKSHGIPLEEWSIDKLLDGQEIF